MKHYIIVLLVTFSQFTLAQSMPDTIQAEQQIIATANAFSKAYINADYNALANIYTEDAKIFPNNANIINGPDAIKERWVIKNGSKILHHKIMAEEITVLGDTAYDYGYFEGITKNADGTEVNWRGKYVAVWKKIGDEWKMYLDIWNRIAE